VVFTGTCELSFIRRPEWLWLAYLAGPASDSGTDSALLFVLSGCPCVCDVLRAEAGADGGVGDRIWRGRVAWNTPRQGQRCPGGGASIRGWTAAVLSTSAHGDVRRCLQEAIIESMGERAPCFRLPSALWSLDRYWTAHLFCTMETVASPIYLHVRYLFLQIDNPID
jgi:hypothetical protein